MIAPTAFLSHDDQGHTVYAGTPIAPADKSWERARGAMTGHVEA